MESGDSRAFLVTVKRHELRENLDNWGRFVSLPSLETLREMAHLLDSKVSVGKHHLEIPLIKLNNLITSIGVDRHRFTDTFKVTRDHVPDSVQILHGGEEEQRQKMTTSPNASALPIIDAGKSIFEEKAGRLLLPNRIRVNTAHVISLLAVKPIISNIFYAIRLKKETLHRLKALCLWLNTTWGILTILGSREETHGGFISLNQSHWRLLPVLDIDSLSQDKVKALAAVFDEFKDKKPARIPDQYGLHGEFDKFRTDLDLAFLKALGIEAKGENFTSLYHEIAGALGQWMGA